MSDDSAPIAQGDGWSSNMGEAPRADNNHFAQLLDQAGLSFNESGVSLMSSSAEFLPKRYGISTISSTAFRPLHSLRWTFPHPSCTRP
jgi:hypothetical protein